MAPLPDLPWFATAPRTRPYLAGVSGGADSVALLHLLHAHGFREVVVCHLNHGLRGDEAEEDSRFVAGLAQRLGYVCRVDAIDLPQRMAASGRSLETEAREARHEFFLRWGRSHGCSAVLLGHHCDDQAETILWNLLRGSHGLTGMKALQTLEMDGGTLELHRPLLPATRADLRAWLTAHGHAWREDASNAQPIAVRNRLRHEALPLLEEIARRDVRESLTRAEAASQDLLEIQNWAVEQACVTDPQGRLHLPRLLQLPAALQAACVHHYLRQSGIPGLSREVIARCVAALSTDADHAVTLPGGRHFRRRQGRGFITE